MPGSVEVVGVARRAGDEPRILAAPDAGAEDAARASSRSSLRSRGGRRAAPRARCSGSRCSGTCCLRGRGGSRSSVGDGLLFAAARASRRSFPACRSRTAARASPRTLPAADAACPSGASPSIVVTARRRPARRGTCTTSRPRRRAAPCTRRTGSCRSRPWCRSAPPSRGGSARAAAAARRRAAAAAVDRDADGDLLHRADSFSNTRSYKNGGGYYTIKRAAGGR